MKSADKKIKTPLVRRLIPMMWVCFGLAITAVIVLLSLIYNGVIGYMPDIEELKNPQDKFASVIYSADGQ